MLINISDYDEDYANKYNLNIEHVLFIAYMYRISKKLDKDEFQYSYADMFDDLKIIFFTKSLNSKYKKVKKILDHEGVQAFITRSNNRKCPNGIEVTFKLNTGAIKALKVDNMFIERVDKNEI